MNITPEDKNELENLLKIATDQIPKYLNLINSNNQEWEIQNIDEFVFGMVFEKYSHDSGQYLSNKQIDDSKSESIESKMEAYDVGIEVFSNKVQEIKRQIQELFT